MFGKQNSRAHGRAGIAAQAWEQLISTVDSAASPARTAKSRAARVYGEASGRVEAGAKEARDRANNAIDALAGRKPPRRWGRLGAAMLAGAALGWVATIVTRQLASRSQMLPLPESLVGEGVIPESSLDPTSADSAAAQRW